MLDIGFWELLILGVLGLLVLGPERLPQVVRTVGRWVRAVRRTASQLRWQIEQELDINEKPRSPRPPPTRPTSAPGAQSAASENPDGEGGTSAAPGSGAGADEAPAPSEASAGEPHAEHEPPNRSAAQPTTPAPDPASEPAQQPAPPRTGSAPNASDASEVDDDAVPQDRVAEPRSEAGTR